MKVSFHIYFPNIERKLIIMDSKLYVFGHKNPDTDSITSSIVLANLERALGYDATAYKLGNINKETKYALKTFEVEEPQTLESIEEGSNVILVDHNESAQSVLGIEKANVKMVVDHHKIKFETSDPIYYIAEPVGCTATILYKLYRQNNVDIDTPIAGLMLSAIVSDTLLFKSPTCTDQDKKVAEELAQLAGVDINTYGKEMLKAGTDISDFTPCQVINMDAKVFDDKNTRFEISQVNAVDLDSVLNRQDELEEAINKEIEAKSLDLYIFAITDILNANSKVIVLGNKANIVEKAFGVKLENHTAMLNNIVSRKKQILPNILNALD